MTQHFCQGKPPCPAKNVESWPRHWRFSHISIPGKKLGGQHSSLFFYVGWPWVPLSSQECTCTRGACALQHGVVVARAHSVLCHTKCLWHASMYHFARQSVAHGTLHGEVECNCHSVPRSGIDSQHRMERTFNTTPRIHPSLRISQGNTLPPF